MYQYDQYDQAFVQQRVDEFRNQVNRRLTGALNEEEFKPLRLMNGLYLQLHAYMLRVAIPYGALNSQQMHVLADLAEKYDRGYGHFTTRQNIQYNWPKLKDVPDMLQRLADAQMHAIQTSGNCIRNVTSDPYAGAAADEYIDPRPYAELIRQWSSLHPEFTFLPRKFKFAITGAAHDRAAIAVHDIGIRLKATKDKSLVAEIHIGGGQGRTPRLARPIYDDLAISDLLPYMEAILRVYNRFGRRDNKYKARIKILVDSLGIEAYQTEVEKELAVIDREKFDFVENELLRIKHSFKEPDFEELSDEDDDFSQAFNNNPDFAVWAKHNLTAHRKSGYAVAAISLKPYGGIPGDCTTAQMNLVADLAAQYGHDEIRVTHRQNLILPHVQKKYLYPLWQALVQANLAQGNLDQATDIISCPGLDYCALATARSIPVAQILSDHLAKRSDRDDIGPLTINISGCINACGHHHVANIGILGLDRAGVENYQITLGGAADEDASLGKVAGHGFSFEQLPGKFDQLIDCYMTHRASNQEKFIDTFNRIGPAPFKESLYSETVSS